MSKRLSRADIRRQGRLAERADVAAHLDMAIAGAQAFIERHAKAEVEPGIDLTVFIMRLSALKGTLEAGCHEGLAR